MAASGSDVILEITQIEAAHLRALARQYRELVADSIADGDADDPAVRRLSPDAYRDSAEDAAEFRRATESDLLEQRAVEAATVIAALTTSGVAEDPAEIDDEHATMLLTLQIPENELGAWLRTLAGLRLVLASRLGVDVRDDHAVGDPRYAIYDWLGYRLETLLDAADRLSGSGGEGDSGASDRP